MCTPSATARSTCGTPASRTSTSLCETESRCRLRQRDLADVDRRSEHAGDRSPHEACSEYSTAAGKSSSPMKRQRTMPVGPRRPSVKTRVLSHLVPADDPQVSDRMWIEAAQSRFRRHGHLGRICWRSDGGVRRAAERAACPPNGLSGPSESEGTTNNPFTVGHHDRRRTQADHDRRPR